MALSKYQRKSVSLFSAIENALTGIKQKTVIGGLGPQSTEHQEMVPRKGNFNPRVGTDQDVSPMVPKNKYNQFYSELEQSPKLRVTKGSLKPPNASN